MDQNLRQNITQYLAKNPSMASKGRRTEKSAFDALPKPIRKRIPLWYQELMVEFPLAGLPIGIPDDFGQEQWIGRPIHQLPLMNTAFLSLDEMVEEMEEAFPGVVLKRKGWIPFSRDVESTFQPIFLDASATNPPVRLFFHDMGENYKELLANSSLMVLQFCAIFEWGKIPNKYIRLTDHNREKVAHLIRTFISQLDQLLTTLQQSGHEDGRFLEQLASALKGQDQMLMDGEYLKAFINVEWVLGETSPEIRKPFIESIRDIYVESGYHIPDSPLLVDYY